jgi:peptidoglycan/xylan/chitin deacetylase (PgdA/CDA1 family)
MYHEIAEDKKGMDAWTIVRKSDFMRQMQYAQNHFEVIGLEEALSRISNNRINRPTLIVTFDDGYLGNKEVVMPIVNSMRLPITVFVATKFVTEQKLYWYDRLLVAFENRNPFELDLMRHGLDSYQINFTYGATNWCEKERLLSNLKSLHPENREVVVAEILSLIPMSPDRGHRYIAPLTIEDLRVMAESPFIKIGAHSHCHNILTQLSEEAMRNSVLRSKKLLELWIGQKVEYFAYPNGNYDNTIIKVLKETGFLCGLTTRFSPWERGESQYTIPRIGIGRYDSFNIFKAKISGAFKYS